MENIRILISCAILLFLNNSYMTWPGAMWWGCTLTSLSDGGGGAARIGGDLGCVWILGQTLCRGDVFYKPFLLGLANSPLKM